ncbi:MAG: hypothetical protein WKF66_04145 [Pedobacter sp.]
MEHVDSLASKEVLIIIITQILLCVALFVRLGRSVEKAKLEYGKQSLVYQLNQAEHIRQKWERTNDLFTHLIENKSFVEKVTYQFINEYSTIDRGQKNIYLEGIQERNKNILMKTSFYVDKDTKDLITEYLMSCSTLTLTAHHWGNSLSIISKADGGGVFVNRDDTPVDVDVEYFKNRIPNYVKAFDEQQTNIDEYFVRIETALKNQLDLS